MVVTSEFDFTRKMPWLVVGLPPLVPLIMLVYYSVEGFQGDPAVAWISLAVFMIGWLVLASAFVPHGRLRVGSDGISIVRGWHRLDVPWAAVTSIHRELVEVQLPGDDTEPQVIRERDVGSAAFDRKRAELGWPYRLIVSFEPHADIRRRGYFMLMRGSLQIQPGALCQPGVEEALSGRWHALRSPIGQPERTRAAEHSPIVGPTVGPAVIGPTDAAMASQIAQAFETVRDRFGGSLAAPASALPASIEAVAAAIATQASGASAAVREACAEAIVDLAAFVPDEQAAVVSAWQRTRGTRATPSRGSVTDEFEQEAGRALSHIAGQRARLAAQVRPDLEVAGDWGSLSERIPIGEARRVLNLRRDSGEAAAVVMLTSLLVLAGAAWAGLDGRAWGWVALAGWGGSVAGALLATWADNAIDRLLARRLTGPVPCRHSRLRDTLLIVLGVAGPIAAMLAVWDW